MSRLEALRRLLAKVAEEEAQKAQEIALKGQRDAQG